MMAELRDVDFLAAAVGETGMAWDHVQRALLHCRRSGREDVSNLALQLDRIGRDLTGIVTECRTIGRR